MIINKGTKIADGRLADLVAPGELMAGAPDLEQIFLRATADAERQA